MTINWNKSSNWNQRVDLFLKTVILFFSSQRLLHELFHPQQRPLEDEAPVEGRVFLRLHQLQYQHLLMRPNHQRHPQLLVLRVRLRHHHLLRPQRRPLPAQEHLSGKTIV